MSETVQKGNKQQMTNNVTNLSAFQPPTPPPLTDSQLAAYWASQALGEGRIDLGMALARLAGQARDVEQAAQPVYVPLAGATREEQPRPAEPAPVTQIFEKMAGQYETATAAAVPGSRCHAPVVVLGIEGTCGEGIYWDNDRWLHIDTALDNAHPARRTEVPR